MITITYVHRCGCSWNGMVTYRHWHIKVDHTIEPSKVLCAETGNELEIIGFQKTS